MASQKQVLILLFSLITVSSIFMSTHGIDCPANISGGNFAVYWGQRSEATEGDLTEACDSGLYSIVIIAYLHVSSSSIVIDLRDHCPGGDCTALASDIKYCQSKGIKVFLSVEVDSSGLDATSIATYLFNNFLSGSVGPLGPVTLDGIDLAIGYSTSSPWEELVKAINGSTEERKIYQSAAPRCDFTGLDGAIATGLLDYIWVLYYDYSAPCEYLNNNATNLLKSWETWTSKVLLNSSVYLGLVASNDSSAASSGYIPPDVLKSEILPTVKEASNFGGVTLWNRYYDKETGYSEEIKGAFVSKVCECVCQDAASSSSYGLLSKYM